MPENGPPIDDDVLALIERFRARSTQKPREPVVRRSDRRVADRRGLGFTAHRRDDAERNRQQRTFVLSFLRQLPDDTLWAWIDGLLLGGATDAQLDVLVQAVKESGLTLPPKSRPKGRPRETKLK